MTYNEFYRPISVDFAPRGRVCEWCNQPAERQLTAIGGVYHNRSGVFCHACGEQFAEYVRRGSFREMQEREGSLCA
jgi:hypothetical protein